MDLTGLLIGWAEHPGVWGLFCLGLLLVEAALPVGYWLWFGLAAIAVGAVGWFLPPQGWQSYSVAWGILAVILMVVGKRYYRGRDHETEDPHLNERASRYLGRVFTLAAPLIEDHGSLKVDDTIWRISGPDMSAGTRIKVIGVDGPILKVDRA